jgi:hypothetical protein
MVGFVANGHARALRQFHLDLSAILRDRVVAPVRSPKEKAELDLLGGGMTVEAAAPAGPKPSFPAEDVMQTAAVMAALAAASSPLDADAIARTFKQGRKVSHKVGAVLAALARVGFISTTDGGVTFLLRRVA